MGGNTEIEDGKRVIHRSLSQSGAIKEIDSIATHIKIGKIREFLKI